MADCDIKLKIKEVIEATILSIVQEQSEKIEKLERIVEQQQDRIQLLEQKLFNTDQQRNVRKDSKHHTTNPSVLSQQTSSNTMTKPDSNLIKTQLKKLEIEKEKASDQKQQSNQKQRSSLSITQPNQNHLVETKQQLNKQFQRGEPVKVLPDPKTLKTQTSETTQKSTNQHSAQNQKQPNQINKASSQRDLIGMKKSPSQTLVYTTDTQIKSAQSPKNGQKSQFFSAKQDMLSPQSPQKVLSNKNIQKDQQGDSQQQSQNLLQDNESILKDSKQLSIQQLEESDTHSQNQEYHLQKSDTQTSEIISEVEQEELIELNVDFKQMTIDTFDMIEQNFVNDLIQQQDLPEAANIVVYIFLKIVTDINAFSYDDEKFWEKALKFLLEHEKNFPQFLALIKKKIYKKRHLELIDKLITENPDVIDPEKFEEIDALVCSLSYFIKDFSRALKKQLV